MNTGIPNPREDDAGELRRSDGCRVKQARVDKVVRRNRIAAKGRFLELGCGAGNITLYMAGKGFDAYGMDIVPAAIEGAESKRLDVGSSAHFRVGDATDLCCYPDGFFDLVYDGDCLWMIMGVNRRKCLRGVFRILKPGGVFMARARRVNDQVTERCRISTHVYFDPQQRISVIDDVPMYYFSMEREFKQEFSDAGFEIRYFESNPRSDGDEPFVAGDMLLDAVKPLA